MHYLDVDAELVIAARHGDRAAFAELVERHHAALLRACRGSADAAQEAVLVALTNLPSLRDDDAFGAWLCGIGRNLLAARSARARSAAAPRATLARRLAEEDRPRPDTYRFSADLLAAAGGRLEEVRIVRLADVHLLRRGACSRAAPASTRGRATPSTSRS